MEHAAWRPQGPAHENCRPGGRDAGGSLAPSAGRGARVPVVHQALRLVVVHVRVLVAVAQTHHAVVHLLPQLLAIVAPGEFVARSQQALEVLLHVQDVTLQPVGALERRVGGTVLGTQPSSLGWADTPGPGVRADGARRGGVTCGAGAPSGERCTSKGGWRGAGKTPGPGVPKNPRSRVDREGQRRL